MPIAAKFALTSSMWWATGKYQPVGLGAGESHFAPGGKNAM